MLPGSQRVAALVPPSASPPPASPPSATSTVMASEASPASGLDASSVTVLSTPPSEGLTATSSPGPVSGPVAPVSVVCAASPASSSAGPGLEDVHALATAIAMHAGALNLSTAAIQRASAVSLSLSSWNCPPRAVQVARVPPDSRLPRTSSPAHEHGQ